MDELSVSRTSDFPNHLSSLHFSDNAVKRPLTFLVL
jgi:hypothetical protein